MSQIEIPPGALTAPSTARNREPILQALRAHLPARGRVLEIAAGAGEHALFFAQALPGLEWTPSDPGAEARTSIEAWRSTGPANLMPPLTVDMLDETSWPQGEKGQQRLNNSIRLFVGIGLISVSARPSILAAVSTASTDRRPQAGSRAFRLSSKAALDGASGTPSCRYGP